MSLISLIKLNSLNRKSKFKIIENLVIGYVHFEIRLIPNLEFLR